MEDKELTKRIQRSVRENSQANDSARTASIKLLAGQDLTEEETKLVAIQRQTFDAMWVLLKERYPDLTE